MAIICGLALRLQTREKINQFSSPEEPTTILPENKLQSPSEDQEVEEDPLEDKIHRILSDLEERFC